MYDALIIGGGPAGLAAAVYFARQKLSFAMVTKDIGGQALWSSDVENYLGFHLLNGIELVERFQSHLKDYKAAFDLFEGESAVKLDKMSGGFFVQTEQRRLEGRTVLIVSGAKHRALNVPGEQEFVGHGLTYCATCDAPLFRDRSIHVIGGGNSAMDAALFASKYAKRITILALGTELAGDDSLKRKVLADPKIEVRGSTKTLAFHHDGDQHQIELQTGDQLAVQESTEGVIVEIGLVPQSDFVSLVKKDQRGQIIIDKTCATGVEGIWAAGDVTDIVQKQIAVAVGEGSKAALSIIAYLQTRR